MKTMLKSNQGMAMMMVLVIMVILLSITGASLLLSGLNLKTANNLRTGGGAIHVADAGVQHALAVVPSGTYFSDFLAGTFIPNTGFSCTSPCNGTNKPTLTGSLSGYTYTVVAENDPTDGVGTTSDTNKLITLTSTATGPNNSIRKVKAYVGRSTTTGWAPPGTIYIPGGANSDANFKTTGSFFISGNDTNYSADTNNDGRADSTSAGPNSSIYGVAPLYDSMVSGFLNSLSSTEKTQVQGNGYNASTSPVTPSVFKSPTSFSVSEMANNFKSQPGAVPYTSGFSLNSTICPPRPPEPTDARCKLGSDASPQITYIQATTGNISFGTGSTVTGSGVLILDGKANIFGNFEFHGIVISLAAGPRGDESTEDKLKLKLKDNARIFGTLLLGPTGDELKFDIKDNAALYYSSQALSLAQTLGGSCCLPQSAKLIAWQEVMQ